MRAGLGAMTVGLVLVAMIGCRAGGQVYEVKDAPVQTASGKAADRRTSPKSNYGRGHQANMDYDGGKTRRNARGIQRAESYIHVTIPYTSKNYSILYKDSSNLRYDPEKRTIHVNYAKWIERLDNEIKMRLSAAGM